tara:strand:- start:49 stop:7203 length:7155 start_codon:yes stop_codon:yes gene_type:complete
MINPQKAVQWYRDNNSSSGESDYDIYEKLKRWYPEYDYADNPFTTQTPKQESIPTKEEVEEKANPGFFKKILTSGLAEAYADESDWWAEAYNKSMAGTLHQLMHGEAKYAVDEVEREWYDEVGQFFVGLVSPMDVLTFFGSSAIGGAAAKTITKGPLKDYALKGMSKMMKNAGVKRGARKKVLEQGLNSYLAQGAAIESGLSLATYGAAGAAIQDQAQQSYEIENNLRDERDYFQTIWAATKHGASSLALGSAAGYVTKGLMAPKFAQAKLAKDPTFANKVTRATMNRYGQVIAEGSLFGTGQIAERALMGEDVDMDDWLASIFMNTGIVGGLRASMKPLRIGQNDVTRYEKAYGEFFGGIKNPKTGKYEGGFYSDINNKKVMSNASKEYKSLKSIEKGYEDAGIPTPKEVIEKIANLEAQETVASNTLNAFGNNLKEYNKLLSDMENISKLPAAEQNKMRAKILKDAGATNLTLYHLYTEMQANREFGYQVYKDAFKGKVTDKKKAEIDKMIDQKVKDLEDVNAMLNGIVTGDPNAIKLAQDKYIGGFEVSAKEVKNKKGEVTGYETVLETPDGSKVSIPKAARIKKTEAEALKVGEELKETYIKGLKGEELEAARAISADVKVVKYTPIKDGKPETTTTTKKGTMGEEVRVDTPVVKEGTKLEVDKMVQEGRAKVVEPEAAPIEKISDPTKTIPVTSLEAKVEQIHSMVSGQQEIAPGVPIKKAYYEKLSKEYNEFYATEKGQFKTDPHKNRMKKEIWESGETKDIINSLSGNDFDMIAAYKMAESLYAKGLATAPQANTKVAIKLIGYLNSKGKNIYELNPTELAALVKEGIPSFDISYIRDGRDVSKTIQSSKLFNSGGISALRQIIGSLRANEFISGTKKQLFDSLFTGFDRSLNEARGKNIKPAKEGVRKNVLKRAKQLSDKKKDEGYNIVAQLASKFYVRDEEINRINKKNIKKVLKKEGDEYYLDMSELKKYKTADRIVWVDKELATLMQIYDGNLSSKKYVTEVGKLTPSDNKKRLTDTRRRAQTIGGKTLDGPEYRKLNWLLGHDESAIKQIYDVANIKDVIASQKDLHKKLNSPISELAPGGKEFRVISKGEVPAPKEVHAARKYELSKRYPELVTEMVKEFKDKAIPEDAVGYLEKLESWTIKVKLGRAPSDTIPHEVSHYVFKILDVLSKSEKSLPKQTVKTMSLYNQAKKLFVNKDGKFVEEDAVLMIGKAIDKQLDAPMMSKATGFFKKLNMWFKSIFNKPLSKEEIAYALGEKIIRREGIPTVEGLGVKTEFRTVKDFKDSKAFANAIGREVRLAGEKFGLKPNELIEFVAKEAGIINPKKFRITVPKDELSLAHKTKVEQLNSFINVFEGLNLQEYVGKKNILRKLGLVKEIEDLRMSRNITISEQKRLLKDVWGVREGNMYQASYDKLKAYAEYMRELDAVEKDNVSFLTTKEISDLNMKSLDKGLQRLAAEGNLLVGTVHSALKTIGLKKLSQKMLNHYVLQENNASGLTRFHVNSYKILGGNPLTSESRLNVIKNKMTMALDNNGEMLLGLKKWANSDAKLPKGERKRIKDAEAFLDKAIKPEWKNTIKKNKQGNEYGDGLAKKNKDGSWKYLNLETKEGQIAQEYINNIQNTLGQGKYESALKQSLNQAEYEIITSKSGIKFIEDGIYMTRVLTQEAKRILNVEGKARDRAIESLALDIAYSRAKSQYGKNFKPEKIFEGREGETIMDISRSLAKEQYSDVIHFNPGKISVKYLKERYSLQDLFVEGDNGKLVRTYEYKFDKTVGSYVRGMSKFYATLEMFPQAIANLKRGNGIHKVFKDAEAQLIGGGSKQLNWAKEVVAKQLGTEKSAEPYEILYRGLEGTARTVAKLGLSFPTAGGKNLLAGTTQTIFAHRLRDVAGGFALVLGRDAEVYNKALESNAFSVGNVIYEGRSRVDKFLDATAFKAGFMKPTEKFNRLLAIAASTYDQRRQLKRLGMFPKDHKFHKRAKDRLKTFYFLTEKEIAMKRKYPSISDVKKDNSLSSFEKAKMMRNIDVIDKKMNTYAHVNTQGSSADLFMPKFAGKEAMKPLTLFKRMAYAATDNTQRNVRYSLRNKDIIRPVMGLTATYLTGSALLQVYSSLLGTNMPKENSDWWRRFWTTMWKGEFLGIMSEVISPYDPSFVDTIHPAIFRTLQSIGLETSQLATGKSNFKQFGEGVFGNISLYANTMKVINRRNNPLNRDRIRINKLYQEYKEDIGKPGPEDIQRTELSPYYEDFRNTFYLGTEEEFAKQFYLTFFAVAHDRVRQGYSMDFAFKDANSQMKSKLKTLNPNRASLNKSSKEGKMASMLFINWLQKHPDAKDLTNRLFEVEAEYKNKLGKIMSKLGHYSKKFNVMSYYDKFNWNI